jgi:hypothetical protein
VKIAMNLADAFKQVRAGGGVSKINDVIGAMNVVGVDEAKAVFDDLNRSFKAAAKKGSVERIYNYYALSRWLYHYALSLGEQERQGRATSPKPSYEAVVKQYRAFVDGEAGKQFGAVWANFESDDLRRFCTHESRRRGSHTPRFYISLAILALFLDENAESLDLIECATPSSERALLDRLHRGICSSLNTAAYKMGKEPPVPEIRPPSARVNPEVFVRFDYEHSNMELLSSFVDRLRIEADNHAHFYVYRSRKRRPTQLMKSFLAIKEYEPSSAPSKSRNFQFTHVYQPPRDVPNQSQKLAMGRVVPMENGIYLVGGQRRRSSRLTPGTVPARAVFHSLHIIYIPWVELREERSVIYGMGLLPNNEGMLLAAKLALIPTGVERGDQANLGSIDLTSLASDLEQSMMAECEGQAFPLAAPDIDLRFVAQHVADFCNNDPGGQNGWDVSNTFKSSSSGSSLTRAQIEHELSSVFGSTGAPKYVADEEGVFEIWKSLRFGPLSLND